MPANKNPWKNQTGGHMMTKNESDKAFQEIERGIQKTMKVMKIVVPSIVVMSILSLIGLGYVLVHFVGKVW